MMDEAGVDMQVLSVSAPNVFRFPEALRVPLTRDLNDEFSDLAGGAGGRLRVFASLPLPAVDAALEELDRALALPHVVGIVVCSNIDRINLDDERFSPVWEELSRRGTTVFCHPTVACCTDGLREYAMSLAMGFMADTMFAVGRLAYAGTFDRFPGIRWIFTHLGGTIPFVLPTLRQLLPAVPRVPGEDRPARRRRSCESCTTTPCTMHAPALRCAVDTLGTERLVFGSDYPHVPGGIDRFVTVLNSVGLSADELAMIGRGTAAGLIGLEEPQTVQGGAS